MKKFLSMTLVLFLVGILFACNETITTTQTLPEVSDVDNFSDYDELETYLKQFYKEQSNGLFYSITGGIRLTSTATSLTGAMEDAVYDSVSSNESTPSFSKTNTQVDGVDESDTIITDGAYIYLISNGRLLIIEAETLTIITTYSEENVYFSTMYYTDDTLVLVGDKYQTYVWTDDDAVDDSEKTNEDVIDYYYNWYYNYGVDIVILDVSDVENVTVRKELYFEQTYLSQSRMIDGNLYLIMNNYYINYGYVDNHFVPEYYDSTLSDEVVMLPAENIYYMPNDMYSVSYLMIASVNVFDDSNAQVDAYIGSTYQIYMSITNLYSVIYRNYLDEETGYYQYQTYVLRFEIIDGKLVYKAMGGIFGSPLNQFSMDEYNGMFRIATTDYQWNDTGSHLTNQLFVMDATSENEMTVVSVLEGLGKPNERIYSVRYTGDIAYVVTFVNTDPMYKLDLSDPYEPKILGELYEEGVSDYLHPVNDDLLIGVGRQAEQMGDWTRFTGVKIGLYDTTGDTPEIIETYFVEGEYSYTPVTYDHKMFVYYQPEGADYWLVAIPVYEYGYVEVEGGYNYHNTQNLYVFKVTFAGDLELVAKLPTFQVYYDQYEYYYDYMQRGLFIGDSLYAISYRSIVEYDISDGFVKTDDVVLPMN